jgi:hypothetical protein
MKDLKETIVTTIDYIEKNLSDRISLDDISLYTGYRNIIYTEYLNPLLGNQLWNMFNHEN